MGDTPGRSPSHLGATRLWRAIRFKLGTRQAPDAFLLSYPKTGRTWLRALIGKVLVDEYRLPAGAMLSTQYLTVLAGLPILSVSHDGTATTQATSYRDLSADKSRYRGKKVILLSRDVRDTMVSSYFQATRREHVFDGTMSEFVRSDTYGVRKMLTFYDHWYRNRHVPSELLFIRYEDLHASPEAVLSKVLAFIGVHAIPRASMRRAVEFASFGNLRLLEEQRSFRGFELRPGRRDDPESFKARKGKVGSYTEYLDQSALGYLEEQVKSVDCPFVVWASGATAPTFAEPS
jgi:hypothetical protein